jgi:hypothetical protein
MIPAEPYPPVFQNEPDNPTVASRLSKLCATGSAQASLPGLPLIGVDICFLLC